MSCVAVATHCAAAVILFLFFLLHERHRSCTLSRSPIPPLLTGIMWSYSMFLVAAQAVHRPLSRSQTSPFTASEICLDGHGLSHAFSSVHGSRKPHSKSHSMFGSLSRNATFLIKVRLSKILLSWRAASTIITTIKSRSSLVGAMAHSSDWNISTCNLIHGGLRSL